MHRIPRKPLSKLSHCLCTVNRMRVINYYQPSSRFQPTTDVWRQRKSRSAQSGDRETQTAALQMCRLQKCEVDDAGEQLAPGLWLRVTSVTQQCNVFTYSLTHDTQ